MQAPLSSAETHIVTNRSDAIHSTSITVVYSFSTSLQHYMPLWSVSLQGYMQAQLSSAETHIVTKLYTSMWSSETHNSRYKVVY